jgi:hypothetical protein
VSVLPDDPQDARDTLLVVGALQSEGPHAHGDAHNGAHNAYAVLRKRGDTVEMGALREVESGKPLHGEVVKLQRRAEHPLLFDVDVLADARPKGVLTRSGPAQVATEAYRDGWDLVFGRNDRGRDPGDSALN